eukprot:scaffold99103_cov30-Tisochrysis_lutea.AAC.3
MPTCRPPAPGSPGGSAESPTSAAPAGPSPARSPSSLVMRERSTPQLAPMREPSDELTADAILAVALAVVLACARAATAEEPSPSSERYSLIASLKSAETEPYADASLEHELSPLGSLSAALSGAISA